MATDHAHDWIPNIYDSGHQVCAVCGADKMEWLEQQLTYMHDHFKPEHERLVQEIASIRGELELANVQRTLLSGAMQQNAALEQQLARARITLEQIIRLHGAAPYGTDARAIADGARDVLAEMEATDGN